MAAAASFALYTIKSSFNLHLHDEQALYGRGRRRARISRDFRRFPLPAVRWADQAISSNRANWE
jgi:hypothetical protein